MFSITSGPAPFGWSITRRELLRVGSLSAFGLGLPQWLQAQQQTSSPRDKNCILLWMLGGASHIDLYDLKPNAPDGIRGIHRPIDTVVPGLHLSELLPGLARHADKFSLIRSMTSYENEHEVGHYYVQSGSFRWSPRTPSLVPPGFGAMVNHQHGARPGVPAFVQIGEMLSSSADAGMGGILGRSFDPIVLGGGRTAKSMGLVLPDGIDISRMTSRSELRAALDGFQQRRDHEPASRTGVYDKYRDQALDMVTTGKAKDAFDLEREPQTVRDAYGPGVGQRMLLARRLIEAGVRFVTVVVFTRYGWDHHPEIFPRLKDETPPYDRGYSALLEDLQQRGLLDNTLVVSVGEFGRTPRLNSDARGPGRDHWNWCFSLTIGGGGVRTGLLLGASDAHAAYPTERPVTIGDLSQTIYHVLGMDPNREVHAVDGRPFKALPEGSPIRELL